MGQRGHSKGRGLYIMSMKKGKKFINCEKIFVHHKIVSAVKRVEFVSYKLSYIVLRGGWCNIIVLNVRALSEEKSDDSKERFY